MATRSDFRLVLSVGFPKWTVLIGIGIGIGLAWLGLVERDSIPYVDTISDTEFIDQLAYMRRQI